MDFFFGGVGVGVLSQAQAVWQAKSHPDKLDARRSLRSLDRY
jgi:hypothetical protein